MMMYRWSLLPMRISMNREAENADHKQQKMARM